MFVHIVNAGKGLKMGHIYFYFHLGVTRSAMNFISFFKKKTGKSRSILT